MELRERLAAVRIVPVIVIKDVAHAVPLAKALVEGGLTVLEITLRSAAGLDAISAIAAEVPAAFVGAGTVITAGQCAQAAHAGAKFLVSPGLTTDVVCASRDHRLPLLPGIATASDIMRGLGVGMDFFKFFPAETSGGAPAIKALGGPFAQVTFCPTGGVSPGNLSSYLSLPNVVCVGGSWMVPSGLGAQGAFEQAARLSREACALARQ